MNVLLLYAMRLLVSIFVSVSCLIPCSQLLAQEEQVAEKSKEEVVADEESQFGLDKETHERLLSSLKNGAFSKNDSICYRSFSILAERPEIHTELGEGVQLELVKRGFSREFTSEAALRILLNSKIKGLERQELLVRAFNESLSSSNERLKGQVLIELQSDCDATIEGFAAAIEKNPLGDHGEKISLIEYLGPKAEKALPALLKRYKALQESAAKDGRPAVYLNVLFAVGEIRSKDGMEVVLDACNERGSKERERYAQVGFECLNRIIGDIELNDVNPNYIKYAEGLMKAYDKNSDGFLSAEEASAMRRPIDSSADANKDGRYTTNEIARSMAGGNKSSRSKRARSTPLIRDSIRFDQ